MLCVHKWVCTAINYDTNNRLPPLGAAIDTMTTWESSESEEENFSSTIALHIEYRRYDFSFILFYSKTKESGITTARRFRLFLDTFLLFCIVNRHTRMKGRWKLQIVNWRNRRWKYTYGILENYIKNISNWEKILRFSCINQFLSFSIASAAYSSKHSNFAPVSSSRWPERCRVDQHRAVGMRTVSRGLVCQRSSAFGWRPCVVILQKDEN